MDKRLRKYLYDLGYFVRSFLGEEVSKTDDVDKFAEENEENWNGGTVNARTNGSKSHQNAIVEISKGKKLEH